MATFRSGFKIFGELTLRQSIGRLRSFSEDRKPGSWLPEDQWAVRPPCTTCPDPCAPKKPAKPSKSWLTICKDPEPPLTCDIRHNNCPPPPKDDEPWYAFITKKKPEKPKPPPESCRIRIQEEWEKPDEEYCEDMKDETWPGVYEQVEPEEPVCPERPPAPVIRLSCPPPKDLDLMVWCGKPGLSVARIASQCQSDKMPYEEFRPTKTWKPPPFSLPTKSETRTSQPFCSNIGRLPFAEYKQVDIPKPLYTRYKSVELEDENFLLCMTDAKCPPDDCKPSLALQPPPLQKPKPPPEKPKLDPTPEKPVLVAASQKPVRLKRAPKFKFRPKPTKLVEKKCYRNPCAHYKTCDLKNLDPPPEGKAASSEFCSPCDPNPPKVITGTLTDEPPIFQPSLPSRKPPHWMYMLSKPGSKDTPLVPHVSLYPSEPDWCGETDGLKFYDGQDEGIRPKPPPDPYKRVANQPDPQPAPPPPCPPPPPVPVPLEEVRAQQEKFVLMPDKYNIRNMRPPEEKSAKKLEEASFQEFIEVKTASVRACSKLYPQMKENILYDLVRNCPMPPLDPTKLDPPPRRAPEPECPQPIRFFPRRYYSTFSPLHLRKPNYAKVLNRLMSEDSRDKCKPRKLVPKPRECPVPNPGPSCNEMELPCCPKAKIPPRCDVKRPPPPCKKRLAPKPSYSECSKDPPPCPRITECNAWEKRDMENQRKPKGRRFSNWAAEPGIMSEAGAQKRETAAFPESIPTEEGMVPGPPYSEYLAVKDRGQSLNKSKWSPHKQRKVFSGKELMLNFVNPTEDSNSYYKSDSLVKRRKPQWRKLNSAQSKPKKIDHSVGNQLHERKVISALLQDHHTRNDVRLNNLSVADRESALSLPDEASSKAIVGSIGSWINGLMRAQRKRSNTHPAPQSKMNQLPPYVETADVDRIMKLTKPFRNRVKSRSFENLTYFPVDSAASYQDFRKIPSPFRRFWGRNRNRALAVFPKMKERANSTMWKYETLSPSLDIGRRAKFNQIPSVGVNSGRMISSESGDRQLSTNSMSRSGFRRLGEYSAQPAGSLSGRQLLLNVCSNPQTNNERTVKLHHSKANPLGRQAAAAGPASSTHKNGTSSTALKKSPAKRSVSKIASAPSRSISKFSVTSRGASTFTKTATANRSKTLMQSHRSEMNAPAGETMKKSKYGRMTTTSKRREREVQPDNPNNGTSRFRQSATSSLVANAIAMKKESEAVKVLIRGNGDGKVASQTAADKAVLPLSLPQKPWIYIDKGYDANMKYDFKKSIAHATVIKSKPKKWLHEMDDFSTETRDYLYEGKKGKKKTSETLLKDDLKYSADKYLKRQEVKNMLSKLELKKNVMKVTDSTMKYRQKEQNKKDLMSMLDHHCSNGEKSGGRFGWQHALFRSNAKLGHGKSVIELTEDPPVETDVQVKTLNEVKDSSEIKSLMNIKQPLSIPKSLAPSLSDTEVSKKLNNNVELYDADLDVVECINVDDKPSNLRVDNLKKPTKNSGAPQKVKWTKPQKDGKPKEDKLIGSFTYEKISALSLEGKEGRPMTAAMTRPEMSQTKTLQAVLHTRRYSSNPQDSSITSKCRSTDIKSRPDRKLKQNENDADSQPEEVMCGTKEDLKSKKQSDKLDDFSCRWGAVKKPGPNCPDG